MTRDFSESECKSSSAFVTVVLPELFFPITRVVEEATKSFCGDSLCDLTKPIILSFSPNFLKLFIFRKDIYTMPPVEICRFIFLALQNASNLAKRKHKINT